MSETGYDTDGTACKFVFLIRVRFREIGNHLTRQCLYMQSSLFGRTRAIAWTHAFVLFVWRYVVCDMVTMYRLAQRCHCCGMARVMFKFGCKHSVSARQGRASAQWEGVMDANRMSYVSANSNPSERERKKKKSKQHVKHSHKSRTCIAHVHQALARRLICG